MSEPSFNNAAFDDRAAVIPPGGTIGVFGSGQLGRMLALAARRMGYRIHVFSPSGDTPAGQVADEETVAAYDDLAAVERFARGIDVATVEFENVPVETLRHAEKFVPVHPSADAVGVTQHRLHEKTFLKTHGFPTTMWRSVQTAAEIRQAFAELGPGVIKTAAFGYDGKGQTTLRTAEEARQAARDRDGIEQIYERLIDFEREISVVAARAVDGRLADFGAVENRHAHHILDLSIAPANVSASIAAQAVDITRRIFESLGYVGVGCVEFFVTRDGQLLVNEIAPRPHNSGHWTIEGAATSQFEQQLRAVCGLPLGSTARIDGAAAMAQLLGDLWQEGEPNWAGALAETGVALHLYGKGEPHVGRKMGHLNAVDRTASDAVERVLRSRQRLTRR